MDQRDDMANDFDTDTTSDYLTADRVAALDAPSGLDAPDDARDEDGEGEGEMNSEASSYGSP
jgi:hypothetical protein